MLGISRSATVVCAYLIATTNLSAVESIAHVQSLRGIVCPNLGFRQQLGEYAARYVEDKPKSHHPDVLKVVEWPRIRKLKGVLRKDL